MIQPAGSFLVCFIFPPLSSCHKTFGGFWRKIWVFWCVLETRNGPAVIDRFAQRSLWFAQPLLRNLGQLVRMDPSLGMAEFISNSAILTAVRPSAVLTRCRTPAQSTNNGRLEIKLCQRPRCGDTFTVFDGGFWGRAPGRLVLLVGQRLSGKYVDKTCQTQGRLHRCALSRFQVGIVSEAFSNFSMKCIGPKLPSQIRGSRPADFIALRYIPN